MGLLDKATRKKQDKDPGARESLPGRLVFSTADYTDLSVGLGSLPRRAGFVFEAWRLLAEALPFQSFALLLETGSGPLPLASKGGAPIPGAPVSGSLSDLFEAELRTAKGTPASQEGIQRLAAANPGATMLPLRSGEGKITAHWLVGAPRVEASTATLELPFAIRRLIDMVEGSGIEFGRLAPRSPALFTSYLGGEEAPADILGLRLSAPSLDRAIRGLDLSAAGAAHALSQILRLALGEKCLAVLSPSCLCFFSPDSYGADGELLLSQLRKSIGRALPSFAPLADLDFQSSVFKSEDRGRLDALLRFSGV